jgi:hypothetical protein
VPYESRMTDFLYWNILTAIQGSIAPKERSCRSRVRKGQPVLSRRHQSW